MMNNQLPVGWLICTFGEIASIRNGYAFKSKDFKKNKELDSDIPLVKQSQLVDGKVDLGDAVYLPHKFLDEYKDYVIKKDDILIGMSGSIGKVCYYNYPFEALQNQRTGKIEFFSHNFLNAKYLGLYLSNIEQELIKRAKGMGVQNISAKDIEALPFPLPPFNEQKRIVAKIEELFSELDNGIAALKTAREKLKLYRQAVLKHAFEGKLTAQWREENKDKLETPEQLLARIPEPKQPKGGRKASVEVIEGIAALAVNKPEKKAPKGWRWTPLLRIARQETGHTPSRKHPEYWGGGEFWIGIVDARMHHGMVIHDTLQKVTELGLKNSSARTLPEGTVCLSRTASVGYVTIMGKSMATSQDFATWTCTEALNPKFLMYAFMAEGDEIRRFGKGTTHTTIYFPEIRALHICLPSLQEQEVIVQEVENKLQRISSIETEIEIQLKKAEVLRQSILKKAFSGQLVPQDPNDEPASELLARIQAEKISAQNTKNSRRKKSQK